MARKPHEKSPREKQLEALKDKVSDLIQRTPRIRVVPRDDAIRNGMVHPDGFLKFPHSGSVEWPLDGFTQRRIRDGTVLVEAGQKLDPAVEQLIPEAGKYVEHHTHPGGAGYTGTPQQPVHRPRRPPVSTEEPPKT